MTHQQASNLTHQPDSMPDTVKTHGPMSDTDIDGLMFELEEAQIASRATVSAGTRNRRQAKAAP